MKSDKIDMNHGLKKIQWPNIGFSLVKRAEALWNSNEKLSKNGICIKAAVFLSFIQNFQFFIRFLHKK